LGDIRKVFLDELPKCGKGKGTGHGNEGTVNWKESIGKTVAFTYDNITGNIKIIDCLVKNIVLKYKEYPPCTITMSSFVNGSLGGLLKEELFRPKYNKNDSKRVDLRLVPLNGHGIDWKQVAKDNMIIPFVYDDIEGYVKIIDYKIKGQTLLIKYSDKQIFNIKTSSFIKCMLGELLGKINHEYTYMEDQIIKDNKRNIIITKCFRKIVGKGDKKYYKYKCLKCGNEDEIAEGDINKGVGCNACGTSYKKIKRGLNDIATTHPYLVKYFVDIEDAYKYSFGNSIVNVLLKCPDCGFEKPMKLATLSYYNKFSCPVCGDGISYPNKFIFNMLEQLKDQIGIFDSEKTFNWSKKVKYKNKTTYKRYDFYLNKFNTIVEAHGKQHYEESTKESKFMNNLKEEKENDIFKENLAKENDINEYIIIDCSESELEFIKESILNSKLNELLDLSNVDWLKCHEFSLSNRVKEVSDLWNSGINNITEISKVTGLEKSTVKKYINKGLKMGWNNYDAKLEHIKSADKNRPQFKVMCIETGDIFNSYHDLDRKSEDIFGIKLDFRGISVACINNKPYKGFNFKRVIENA